MKIAVTVLTFKRPGYLDRTLGSFLDLNASILDRFSIRVLVQEPDAQTGKVLFKYRDCLDQVETLKENVGIGSGWSRLMEGCLGKNRYALHLEDDWESRESLEPYFREILQYMDRNRDVGQVRLRSIASKTCAKNPFRGVSISWKEPEGNVMRGDAHFTFNPAITRVAEIAKILPCTSEKDACIKYDKLRLDCGQLLAGCFVHIGEERVYSWKNGEKSYLR